MKSYLVALLPLIAFAQAGGADEQPHISVTVYDSPHSSGDSHWLVHTTVSYSVGPGYTKMIMGGAPAETSTSAAAAATGTWAGHEGQGGASGTWAAGSSAAASSSAGWGSSAAASPTPKAYMGGAGQVAAGAGAVAFAGLAYLL